MRRPAEWRAKIENTDLRAMNDLLRAHARIDVASGVLSVYSEISVKNGRVQGYVKPIFKDLNVYDKEQDEDKAILPGFERQARTGRG